MTVLAGVAQGCELQDCTLVGCSSGVSITVSSEGPLPEGEYRVALLLDGVAHSCRGPVPDLSALTIRCEPDAPGRTVYFSELGPRAVTPGHRGERSVHRNRKHAAQHRDGDLA